MKKTFVLMIATALSAGTLFAQGETARASRERKMPSPQERAQVTVNKLDEKMKLDASKKAQLVPIFNSYYQDMSQLRAEARATENREQHKAKMKALKTTRDEKVRTALNNKQQYEAYQEHIKEAHAHKGKGHKSGNWKENRGGQRGERDTNN
jgi:hypothetical protein